MGNFRVELNSDGVKALLKSSEMAAICQGHAQSIAGRAGSGYEVSVYTGKTRVNASVSAVTAESIRDNLKNNTLLKAVR